MKAAASSANSAGSRPSCSRVSARPWETFTSRPCSLRSSLTSWLPGTQRAVPASTIPMTRRSTSGERGPRSTRSPRKTALRPSGWRAVGPASPEPTSQPREPSRPATSSKQPWTSPMMSKGPRSPRRSGHSGWRSMTAASASSGLANTVTEWKPSRLRPRRERRRAPLCRRTAWGPMSRSLRSSLRRWQSCGGRSKTMAAARRWNSRARAISPARSSGLTLVASITVSLRPASRFEAM